MRTIDDRDIVINQGGGQRRLIPAALLFKLILATVALVCTVVLFQQVRNTFDPLAREQARAAMYRAQELDDDLYSVDRIAGAITRLVIPASLALAALGGVGVGLWLLYIRFGTVMAVKAHYSVKAIEARYQVPVPQTYSPHITGGTSRADYLPAPTTVDAPALPMPNNDMPTFSQLLDSGNVGKGNPLLLGIDVETGERLNGSWLDLYSTAIGGLPGTGKTTSQRFLACQTALHGAGFVIVDPHAGAGEDSLAETLAPLAPAFLCEPASDDKAILEAVRFVGDIGRRRVQGDRDRRPVVLWIDETTALLSRSSVADPLAELIERIAQEYRKTGVYIAASGQIWTASRTGDSSALRDSFASVLAHRMKRSQARMLLPTEEAQSVERLEKGQAVLWRTSGATNVIQVPNTTAADVRRVAGLLSANPMANSVANPEVIDMPHGKPDGSQMLATSHEATSALESGKSVSSEAARVLGLFMAGKAIPEIVFELRGVKSNQGRTYQRASEEVSDLLRQAMAG